LVLESGTPATFDAHAETSDSDVGVLSGEVLADFVRAFVGESDHDSV
jgi:hypothetical protein